MISKLFVWIDHTNYFDEHHRKTSVFPLLTHKDNRDSLPDLSSSQLPTGSQNR
jgi:hypothetical protein